MSEGLYYKFLKLTTGEGIICTTDDTCDDWYERKTIAILNPVTLNSIKFPKEDMLVESYLLYPWLSFTEDSVIEIPTSKIVVVLNLKPGLIKNYQEYIMYRKSDDSENYDSEYTEEEQEIIDEIMNNLEESIDQYEESDQDDSATRGNRRSTRILH
jgi:hypothetical protein